MVIISTTTHTFQRSCPHLTSALPPKAVFLSFHNLYLYKSVEVCLSQLQKQNFWSYWARFTGFFVIFFFYYKNIYIFGNLLLLELGECRGPKWTERGSTNMNIKKNRLKGKKGSQLHLLLCIWMWHNVRIYYTYVSYHPLGQLKDQDPMNVATENTTHSAIFVS